MAAKGLRTALYWLGGALLCLAIGAASVLRWMQMAEDQRRELLAHQREALAWNRKQLSDFWGDKMAWFPGAEADPALAVLPRSKYNEFDAIYVLYRGEQGKAVLALTQVGGFYGLEPMLARNYPETLIPRKLSREELADLRQLRELIEKRLATLDPQLNQGGWNRHVAEIAGELERLQAAAGNEGGTSPSLRAAESMPNRARPGGVE